MFLGGRSNRPKLLYMDSGSRFRVASLGNSDRTRIVLSDRLFSVFAELMCAPSTDSRAGTDCVVFGAFLYGCIMLKVFIGLAAGVMLSLVNAFAANQCDSVGPGAKCISTGTSGVSCASDAQCQALFGECKGPKCVARRRKTTDGANNQCDPGSDGDRSCKSRLRPRGCTEATPQGYTISQGSFKDVCGPCSTANCVSKKGKGRPGGRNDLCSEEPRKWCKKTTVLCSSSASLTENTPGACGVQCKCE